MDILVTQRVVLVVASSFMTQNFWMWQRLMNSTHECRLSGRDTRGDGDTQTLPAVKKFV